MNEIWKVIEGWERYEVSNKGRIRNSETEMILKIRPDKEGYLMVTLSINNVRTTKKVHRLVAGAFIENPNKLPQVNHKDGNHANNNVENLEWCTSSQNHYHAYRVLGRKPSMPERKGRPVLCVETNAIFKNTVEAGKSVNGFAGPLSSVCRGKRITYKGMHWKYAE